MPEQAKSFVVLVILPLLLAFALVVMGVHPI